MILKIAHTTEKQENEIEANYWTDAIDYVYFCFTTILHINRNKMLCLLL